MLRTIELMFKGAPYHMVGDGFRVSNYFPSATDFNKRMSPFFLLDYHPPLEYPSTSNPRRGVGPHPHRGFETVTIAYQGSVAHHDSAGNAGIIHPGDVQWMTAGGGILHNEYHEKTFAGEGGVMHMMQIWVNLPKKKKLTAPKYQAITNKDIPGVKLPEGGLVRVIAGEFRDTKGPAFTHTPAHMLDLRLKAGATLRIPVGKTHNTALLVLDGKGKVNGGVPVAHRDCVLFRNDGDEIAVSADADMTAILLSGEPIDEPLVHYGPFVMNSVDEINQAIDDYHAGKFGHLDA